MKKILFGTIIGFLLFAAACEQAIKSPDEFTREFAAELQKAAPDAQILGAAGLEVQISRQGAQKQTIFLQNAYDVYKQHPSKKNEIIRLYIDSALETMSHNKSGIDVNRIVPIVKDKLWLTETKKAMREHGGKKTPDHLYDEYNEELIVLYAEDSPGNIRFLTADDLKKLDIERQDLRALALKNLKTLLPEIRITGGDGIYIVTADGSYEASLLLSDSIWANGQIRVKGDIVAAIPTRDLLIVTGSGDEKALRKARELVNKTYLEGAYKISNSFFVLRKNKFVKFEMKKQE